MQALRDILGQITDRSLQFKKIRKNLINANYHVVSGLTGAARNLFISDFVNNLEKPILLVVPDITTALKYTVNLQILLDKNVEFLPSQEASPYERVFSDSSIIRQQRNILRSFRDGEISVLVTTSKTMLNTYLSSELIDKYSLNLNVGESADPYDVARSLVDLGYRRTSMVVDPGEFSLRGDILDVFPISEEPVRIEFFADEIENIRNFDIASQRSIRHIKNILIEPRYEIVIDDENKSTLVNKVNSVLLNSGNLTALSKDVLIQNIDNIISSIESERYFEGIEYLSPFIHEKREDIFDFCPENTVTIIHESLEFEQKIHIQDDKYKSEYTQKLNEGLNPGLPYLLHRDAETILKKLYSYTSLKLDSFIHDDAEIHEEIECKLVPKFLANLDNASNYISDLRTSGVNILIFTEYPQRVASVLSEWECPSVYIESDVDIEKYVASKEVIIMKQGFSEGFIIPEIDLAVITDTELFNRRSKKPTLAKRVSNRENLDYLVSSNDLQPGDFVVHARHGIGKFVGLSKQSIDGQEKDYLSIEYSGTDKLHMPADQINLLSRYRGSGSNPPKLSKMGGVDWDSVKRKVKKSITDIAQDLLNLYATRAKTSGYTYEPDSPWQMEMEDAFAYVETPDQYQAINETKSDMESTKPMDRLICGDVGFGKTEVAIRAAFKALLSGKQVAILVPTTILAQQHYLTFSDRFKPYPVKVGLLSRFRTPKEQKETINNIITGECDIVIGTHRLLQKDVQFKDLGLLIIDEEHRFGVSHKEKLKQMREHIDVLTLSATPIPRTLYMALSGTRDMSLINTPPVNRAPIKTYVGPHNKSLIRTAIIHELEREGQIYFLHNRVQSIHKVAHDLQELIPEARIAVAHGQMPEKELEKIMYEFSSCQYDILVCTTIIESGLDIPNTNTVIIDDADKFGLAQLYQIRGRVGRSEAQAYAYCFYHPDKVLTKEANDRLKAIKDFTTLGSGYQIALRDLEIRGVGNILGSQQHGHMISVGFDMYCSLLDETIHELQGNKVEKKEPPIVDINITAYIPDEWVGDKDQKMIEYKRLADVSNLRELEIIRDEWQDRFGEIPTVVERLIQIIRVRLIAAEIGINSIRESDDCIRIFTDYDMSEWRKYQLGLSKDLARKIRWVKAPATSQNGQSILLLNNSGLLGEEQLNILEELFYNINILRSQKLSV